MTRDLNSHRLHQMALSLLAAALVAGCGAQQAAAPSPEPPTQPPPTATPAPTDTPTATPTPTETPTPTPNATATAAAAATAFAEVILAEVGPILDQANLSTDTGSLAWIEILPLEITETGYGTVRYRTIGEELIFTNFVLHANVTWDSTSGVAGCGFILRSEDDIEQGEQFRFNTLRLSGLPGWDVELWRYGDWQSTLTGTVKTSQAIKLASGSTNEYILVADGSALTMYANGTRLGTVTILRRSEGRLAVFTWQESGTTTCLFEDVWVWDLGG